MHRVRQVGWVDPEVESRKEEAEEEQEIERMASEKDPLVRQP